VSGRAEGRKAFVTGATGGLGRGIARLFLEEGAMVALADLRGAEEARGALGGDGRSTAVELDVRDPASVEAAISEAWDVFGGLDILVNCAGVYPSDLIVDMTVDAWDNVIDTNLKGPFLCSQVMVSRWIEQGVKGHIVNITSGAALRARPGAAHYSTSKAALEMLTRAFALEMAPHHIHVNAVSPGFFDVSSDVNQISRDYVDTLVKTIPWGEGGKPSDIAEAVLFLCSDAASYISGTSLRVDGAYSTGTNALPVSRPDSK
jgi:NAD(P)-dependent dehydrogenase (short-subunit alcohol dehydrogenase family)